MEFCHAEVQMAGSAKSQIHIREEFMDSNGRSGLHLTGVRERNDCAEIDAKFMNAICYVAPIGWSNHRDRLLGTCHLAAPQESATRDWA
jgi:hypothetical protein